MTLDATHPTQDGRPRRRRRPRLGTGLFLIALGLILALDPWHGLPFHRAAALWPLILLAFGLTRMVDRGFFATGAHAALAVGLAFELKAMGYGDWVHRFWPLGLVWIGAVITLRALLRRRDPACGWLHD